MNNKESLTMIEKLKAGLKQSVEKLIEDKKKQDGTLVISRDGKIVHVKARDLK